MHAEHAGGHVRRDPLVVDLAEARALDASEVGAKAANLARLAAAGFPVPDGLVLTPAAEERWEEARPRLLEAAASLGAGRFAVRSSGTAEDLEGASFAGQYETFLSVRLEALPEAVMRVFDSADASRVSAYREAQGEASVGDGRSRMSVLVQAMVDADAAGVAFTANPVTGERREVVVTAVRGLGERLVSGEDPDGRTRQREIAAEREAAEAVCRAALDDRPDLLSQFNALLEVAQRYAVLRERQARDFTLGWPLLRRCVLRLGEILAARGVIDAAGDVFFLTRAEIEGREDLRDTVADRRQRWERQRRLAAPLDLGTPPKALRSLMQGAAEAARTRPVPPDAVLVGEPASHGRATGTVRIVRGLEDFDRFRDGEVLVARLTAPAWTPLFARAAAVVTDGGTLAAHSSLVAREYGIPAVVGTSEATRRLRDGQVVIVDGGAGVVQMDR
jgi:phosphohistidine swiveling domain-containing protein